MSQPSQPPATRRRRRSWTISLPAVLAVLGVVSLGPNQLLGTVFIGGALIAVVVAAAIVALDRHGR